MEYVALLREHVGAITVPVLTLWQSFDYVTGAGRGMFWCNDEKNWSENVSEPAEIITTGAESE